VNEVIAMLKMSKEDAINVVKLMNQGYEMSVANNIYRHRLESKEILKKQAELEAAKEAAAAKNNRFYRSIFGKPVEPRVTRRTQSGNDYEEMQNYYLNQ
jgi:hypothetical protein